MRVSIALKIFGIALALLAALAVTAAVSTRNIARVNDEVEFIASYLTPLSRLAGRIELRQLAQAVEYERMLGLYAADPRDERRLSAADARFRTLASSVDADLRAAERLVSDGLQAATLEADRLEFARLRPMLQRIEKEHQDFEDIALQTLAAVAGGDPARAATLGTILEREMGDLAAVLDQFRDEVQTFTQQSVTEAAQHEQQVLRLNAIITIGAAASGLLFASLVTAGLVRPVRRLVQGTREVEAGRLDLEVPITTADEIGVLTRAFNHMVGQLRFKERIKETFGKYVDPRIVEDLLQRPDLIAAGGERRVVTVFFSDIQGFTALGEKLTPGGLVTVINHYFTLMSEPIARHGGIVDKYIGDAIMAFWSPPFVDEREHAIRACQAALAQLEKLTEFHRIVPELIGVRQAVAAIDIRIGVATGDVVIGNIGSEAIRSYTVMGDTVNLGARLESAAKQYGVRVLINDATRRAAADAMETRELDSIRVAGKTEPVRIFELLAPRGELDPARRALRDTFEEGLAAYRAGQWDEAERRFQECLTIQADDRPARLFLDRTATLRSAAAPASWDGIWTLSHK